MLYFEDLTVGEQHRVGELVLSEADIIAFAQRWDPQPIHVDRDSAAASPMGGVTACGCHVFCAASKLANELEPLAVVAGLEQKLEFAKPVRPDDTLSICSECIDKRVSRSKSDRGIVVFRAEMANQRGETVLIMTSKLMLRRRRRQP